jgi:hypothetical protein
MRLTTSTNYQLHYLIIDNILRVKGVIANSSKVGNRVDKTEIVDDTIQLSSHWDKSKQEQLERCLHLRSIRSRIYANIRTNNY